DDLPWRPGGKTRLPCLRAQRDGPTVASERYRRVQAAVERIVRHQSTLRPPGDSCGFVERSFPVALGADQFRLQAGEGPFRSAELLVKPLKLGQLLARRSLD